MTIIIFEFLWILNKSTYMEVGYQVAALIDNCDWVLQYT